MTPLYCEENSELLEVLPSLVGRLYGEPDELTTSILEEEFTVVASRYKMALGQLLPDVDATDLSWRFHFLIGSMIQLLRFRAPLGATSSHDQFIQGLDQLVDFTEAGLQQISTGTAV